MSRCIRNLRGTFMPSETKKNNKNQFMPTCGKSEQILVSSKPLLISSDLYLEQLPSLLGNVLMKKDRNSITPSHPTKYNMKLRTGGFLFHSDTQLCQKVYNLCLPSRLILSIPFFFLALPSLLFCSDRR